MQTEIQSSTNDNQTFHGKGARNPNSIKNLIEQGKNLIVLSLSNLNNRVGNSLLQTLENRNNVQKILLTTRKEYKADDVKKLYETKHNKNSAFNDLNEIIVTKDICAFSDEALAYLLLFEKKQKETNDSFKITDVSDVHRHKTHKLQDLPETRPNLADTIRDSNRKEKIYNKLDALLEKYDAPEYLGDSYRKNSSSVTNQKQTSRSESTTPMLPSISELLNFPNSLDYFSSNNRSFAEQENTRNQQLISGQGTSANNILSTANSNSRKRTLSQSENGNKQNKRQKQQDKSFVQQRENELNSPQTGSSIGR